MTYSTTPKKKVKQPSPTPTTAKRTHPQRSHSVPGIPLFLKTTYTPPSLQRATLADAPKSARKKLSFAYYTDNVSSSTVDQYFEKLKSGKWGATKSLDKGLKVKLSGIGKEYLTPMSSIAMELSDKTYTSPTDGVSRRYLSKNKVFSVHLNLKKHGLADGIYRFAWVAQKKKQTLYISAPAPAAKALSKVTLSDGKITSEGAEFTYSGWGDDEQKILKRAIALTPPTVLKRISGAKFKLTSAAPSSKGEDGSYSEDKHLITIHTSAFKNTARAIWTIAHEMGHAADLTALRESWSTGKRKKSRSESGSRWHQGKDKIWSIKDRSVYKKKKKSDSAFIKALFKDGIGLSKKDSNSQHLSKGITDYSNTNWLELYAESYALFITDPKTLALIRPSTYQYFKDTYL